MAQFRINYKKVINQAEDISDLSRDLNTEIKNLETLRAQVKREWCGPASEEFQKQLFELIEDMKTTRCNMSNLFYTIKTVAQRIQKEDKRLAEKLARE